MSSILPAQHLFPLHPGNLNNDAENASPASNIAMLGINSLNFRG